jgi:hypothetical protein
MYINIAIYKLNNRINENILFDLYYVISLLYIIKLYILYN